MGFGTFESSRDQGNIVQLFLFRYGTEPDEYFAYTDALKPTEVDHGAPLGTITYDPVPVDRDGIEANGTLDRSAVGLRMDIGTELSEIFRVYPPSNVVTLTIFQGHLDDPDEQFVAIWSGRLVSATRESSELVLSGEPVTTQMRRPGLRRNYQYGCPLELYGSACRANKAAATVTAEVTAIAGTVVTLETGWNGALDADKFVRGIMEWTPADQSTNRRMIVRRTGNQLTLSGVVTNLEVGDMVDVVLGCNRRAFAASGGDCQGLHNNIQNFGGQPWIPIKNVINTNPYY